MAGIVLAAVQVEQPAALLDTAYGQVFLIKLALLVGLFLLAAINRWSLPGSTEAGDPAAARKLARSIAVETLVGFLIFGAAAAPSHCRGGSHARQRAYPYSQGDG